jgi:hypothetical protein
MYFNFMNTTCSGTFVPQPALVSCIAWRSANNALNPNVYINVEDFGNCPDVDAISIPDCPNITGNIEAIYKCKKLGTLNIYASDTSGDIKTLFDNMYAAGRNSGYLLVQVAFNGKLTFNGTVITPEWLQSQGGQYAIGAAFNSNGYTLDYPG